LLLLFVRGRFWRVWLHLFVSPSRELCRHPKVLRWRKSRSFVFVLNPICRTRRMSPPPQGHPFPYLNLIFFFFFYVLPVYNFLFCLILTPEQAALLPFNRQRFSGAPATLALSMGCFLTLWPFFFHYFVYPLQTPLTLPLGCGLGSIFPFTGFSVRPLEVVL